MITLDTSSVLALLNSADPDHEPVLAAFEADPGPYVIPAAILAEVAYMVQVSLGSEVLDSLLADLEDGAYALEPVADADVARARGLIKRYRDLGLGFADAAVIACAERHSGRVLTIDRRDFDVVAGEGTITVLP